MAARRPWAEYMGLKKEKNREERRRMASGIGIVRGLFRPSRGAPVNSSIVVPAQAKGRAVACAPWNPRLFLMNPRHAWFLLPLDIHVQMSWWRASMPAKRNEAEGTFFSAGSRAPAWEPNFGSSSFHLPVRQIRMPRGLLD